MKHQSVRHNIKDYIKYIIARLNASKSGLLTVEENDYKYHAALLKEIQEYFTKHRLLYFYIFDKISIKACQKLLGYNERDTFRYLRKQRNKFIDFVEEQELYYFSKYPYFEIISERQE